jgi:hypothetical protein
MGELPRRISGATLTENVHSETGASAVEFALILTLLVFFLFGTIQFGIAYNRYQGLQAAAREGARIAAVGGSKGEVRSRVRQAQSLFTPTDVMVRIDYSVDDGASWKPALCDDQTGNNCSSLAAPNPCSTAGLGSLIRVRALVDGSSGKYPITIPLFGNQAITYSSTGAFRCEQIGA